MIQRTSETMGNVLIVVVLVASVIAVIGVLVKRDRNDPVIHSITESSPEWVPRVPGSENTPVISGQCGQYDGRYWHRVECPRVDR